MKINKQLVRKIIIEEARNLRTLLEQTPETFDAAKSLIDMHADEISADPYGWADTFESAAQIIRDKERGPSRE
jgi:hypothetical protein